MTERHKELSKSWIANADNWVRAVRGGQIPSRRAGTDRAILEAISRAIGERNPVKLLDIGCGEGWLLRRLAGTPGLQGVGIDASAPLIEAARQADSVNCYDVVSYTELIEGADSLGGGFNVIAFNFALLEDDSLGILSVARGRLVEGGAIVIQTLHPDVGACSSEARDGWRIEDFSAFEDQGWTPMPWYFRTLESWQKVVRDAGLTLRELIEPTAGPGQAPMSLLMVCESKS